MNKEYLSDFEKKLKNYDYEINKLEKYIKIEENRVTADSVQGSSKYFPFVKRNFGISGYNLKRVSQIKKRLKIFKIKKEKIIKELKYKIDNLEDRQMADILERRYLKNQEWNKISRDLKYAGESGARKYFNRFLKNN